METATIVLAGATVILAVATIWIAHISSTTLNIQVWMSFESRFDSKEMKNTRAKVAGMITTNLDVIPFDVFEFFESLGAVYIDGNIHKKMVENSFSWYAIGWWKAANKYIKTERIDKNDDSLYEKFEKLVNVIENKSGLKFCTAVPDFLEAEQQLRTKKISTKDKKKAG